MDYLEDDKMFRESPFFFIILILLNFLILIPSLQAETIVDTYTTSDQCSWWDSVLNIFREYDCGEIPLTYNNLSTLELNEKELGLIINESDNGLKVSWEHLSNDEDIKQTFKLTVMSNTSRTVEPYLILSDYSGQIDDLNITDLNITYLEKNIAYEYKTKWCSDYTYSDCQFEQTETYYVNGGLGQQEVITYRNVLMPVSESMYNKKYGFYDSGNIKETLVIDINDLVLEAGKEKSFIISLDNLRPTITNNKKTFTGTFSIMIDNLEYWDKTHSSYWLYEEDIYPTAYTNQTQIAGNTSVLEINNSIGNIPYDNLVGYWAFDSDNNKTAFDWSGNNNHGTYNGNAYAGSGLYGDSLNLDGAGDFINFGENSLSGKNFTLSIWVNPSQFQTSYPYISNLFGLEKTGQVAFLRFGDATLSNNKVQFNIYIGGEKKLNGVTEVPTDEWTHIVGVYNSTHQILYINGVQDAIRSQTGVVSALGYFGISYSQDERYYNGSVDEAMIFDTALSPSQITDLYNNQSSKFKESGTTTFKQQNVTSGYNRINLTASFDNELGSSVDARVGYWDVDKGYYSTGETDLTEGLVGHWAGDSNANDSSGNGNNGTFVGNANANSVGIYNNSFEFDGEEDYVSVGESQWDLTWVNTTISAWINKKGNSSETHNVGIFGGNIFSKGAGGTGGISFGINEKPELYTINTVGFSIYSSRKYSLQSISLNEWNHVLVTLNDTHLSFYINGEYDSSHIYDPAGLNDFTAFIGALNANNVAKNIFNGSIDDVMIFNRSLSAKEVEELYVKGLAKFDYTAYQELESNIPETFTIDQTTTNILPDFRLNAGTNEFYTPVIYGDINLETWNFTGEVDTTYPQYSNYQDNNYTLTDSGTGQFNVTIINTNGTAYLNIDGTSILATNLTYGGDIYNATYDFTSAGVYVYNWTSYGNGTSNLFNRSVDRYYYVNTSVGCEENFVNTTKTDWYSITGCRINDTILQERNWTQYDSNDCGTYENETFYEYQEIGCNYCSYNLENTTKTDWENIGNCLINDTQFQNRSWIQYDTNYSTCYLVTGLESDLYENETYLETQETSCNYCSYNVVNTSWGNWENYQCSSNEMQQIRNLTEYDDNYSTCYSITGLESDLFNSGNNNTYYDYQLIGNNWTNTSWSDWNEGICQINDLNQSRNLTEYDTYGCGLNNTYYEYNLTEAILVNTTKNDWDEGVCQINDLNQSRNWTQYDSLNLGCYTNETFIEYNLTEANIVYTDWTSWEDVGCINDTAKNQSRSRIEYDANNLGCFVNVTHYEYQTLEANLVNTTKTDWSEGVCSGNDLNQSRSWVQYDSNNIGCYTNITFYEYNLTEANLVYTDWSEWENLSCSSNQMNQSRSRVQYDTNNLGCFVNVTEYDYQLINNFLNTSWTEFYNVSSCRINDTILQEQNLTQYDEYGCGLNTTYYNYTEISCDYCSYSVVNSSWSEWENLSCINTTHRNQSRYLIEYDENYNSCYLITGLESDLFNSGNNNTYYEYQSIEDSSCKLTPSLSITSSAGLSLTAGESTIVTGNGCPEELTCNLYFNGTNVINPYTTPALTIGTYELLFNTTGNVNYTSSSVTRNLVVSSGGTTSECRYKKFGYYNLKIPWFKQTGCV